MKHKNRETVLVVAAHPDDELLGAAGTLAKHVQAGDRVHILILGEGLLSRDGAKRADLSALQESAKTAGDILGVETVSFASFPDNAFDTVPMLDTVKVVERYVTDVMPSIVYTHHEYDLNIDHQRTCQAVMTACRPCYAHCPARIYTFETLSSTEWQTKGHKQFQPSVYVDIADTLEVKLKALSAYEAEMRPYPHSRSYEGVKILAAYRGLESGLSYAEAFHVLRDIRRTV